MITELNQFGSDLRSTRNDLLASYELLSEDDVHGLQEQFQARGVTGNEDTGAGESSNGGLSERESAGNSNSGNTSSGSSTSRSELNQV